MKVPAWGWWGQREGLVLPGSERGPDGERLCRWCRSEVEAPRRAWCSDECVQRYQRVWTWGAMRDLIRERDEEACQRCGTTDPPSPKRARSWQQRTDPWDVDHIVPVADGGTDDPANLRLLCIPCHIEVGYEQRGTTTPEPDTQTTLELETSTTTREQG